MVLLESIVCYNFSSSASHCYNITVTAGVDLSFDTVDCCTWCPDALLAEKAVSD